MRSLFKLLLVAIICICLCDVSQARRRKRWKPGSLIKKAASWAKGKWEGFKESDIFTGAKRITTKFIDKARSDIIPWMQQNRSLLIKVGVSTALLAAAIACGACAIAAPIFYARAAVLVFNAAHTGIEYCKKDAACNRDLQYTLGRDAKADSINWDDERLHTDAAVAIAMENGDEEYLATPQAQANQLAYENKVYTPEEIAAAIASVANLDDAQDDDIDAAKAVPEIRMPDQPMDYQPMDFYEPLPQVAPVQAIDTTQMVLLATIFLLGSLGAVVCALLVGKRQQNQQLRQLLKGTAKYQPVSQDMSS